LQIVGAIWLMKRGAADESDRFDDEQSQQGSIYQSATTNPSTTTKSDDDAKKARADDEDVLMSLRRDANTFDNSELQRQNKIGEGSFGEVYRATLNGQQVAVKTLVSDSVTAVDELVSEAKLMARLPPHENVLLLLGVVDAPHLALVLEFCAGGSLVDKLDECAKVMPTIVAACFDDGFQHMLFFAAHAGCIERRRDATNVAGGTAACVARLGTGHAASASQQDNSSRFGGAQCVVARRRRAKSVGFRTLSLRHNR
jgi:hypothetical protein